MNGSAPVQSSVQTNNERKYLRAFGMLAKLAFALLLILWMVHSGRLDLRAVARSVRHWPAVAALAGLCYVSYALMALRWKLLLVQQGIGASFQDSFSLSMIGGLFNTIIPGAVSGDLVKAYYVSLRYPQKRAQAVTTILLDRTVGLFSLLTLSAVAGTWNFSTSRQEAKVEFLYWIVVISTVVGIALPLLMVGTGDVIIKLVAKPTRRFPRLKPIVESVCAIAVFCRSPFTLSATFLISLAGQCAICLGVYVVGLSISAQTIPIGQLLFAIPLGLATMALPIAPAGLGVAQVVFYTLFSNLSPGAGPVGASMVTVFQVVYVLVSSTGIVFYVTETSMRRAVAIASE